MISNSNFINLNYKTQLVAIRPNDSRARFRFDPSGMIASPLFQYYGLLLNLEDFLGLVQLSECTISKSFVTIPGIQFGLHSTLDLPQNNLSYFYNPTQNHYSLCLNKYQLLVSGIRKIDALELNLLLEHHSIIYISRP